MEEEIKLQLQKQGELLDEIYASVEKTRKYFLWTMIATVILFVLPLIIFLFVLPSFFNNLTGSL